MLEKWKQFKVKRWKERSGMREYFKDRKAINTGNILSQDNFN